MIVKSHQKNMILKSTVQGQHENTEIKQFSHFPPNMYIKKQ